MKNVQDNFSNQAGAYATYRPTYPDALYEFLYSIVPGFDAAWDCATGNGQVAIRLAERFKTVQATDISAQQIAQAQTRPNIIYGISRGEKTSFPDNSFDLIAVGTALHWFDFDNFYTEVKRVAKPGAILAVWAYNLLTINEKIDSIVRRFYTQEMNGYWDKERKHVDESYANIPFPFLQLDTPELFIEVHWTIEHMIGYLHSWSAVQHYIDKNDADPVLLIATQLREAWGPSEQLVRFPLFMKVGIVEK